MMLWFKEYNNTFKQLFLFYLLIKVIYELTFDVLFWEEDLDLEVLLAPVGGVGNAGVVDTRQTKSDNLKLIFHLFQK